MKSALGAKEVAFGEKVCQYGRLDSELRADQAVIGTGEGVKHNFAERVCTHYTLLVRAQALTYRKRLNAAIGGAHFCDEYLSGYRVCGGGAGHCLHVNEADIEEKQGVPPRVDKVMVMTLRCFHGPAPGRCSFIRPLFCSIILCVIPRFGHSFPPFSISGYPPS